MTAVKINLQQLASKLTAIENCKKSGNAEWEQKHSEAIEEMLKELPSGSGIDAGMKFHLELSNTNKLVFSFGFHHMEDGYYSGWTEHKLIITPSFGGFDLNITGRDKNEVKEYLYDLFSEVFE